MGRKPSPRAITPCGQEICPGCHEGKPLEAFTSQGRRCRACQYAVVKAWRDKNRQRFNATPSRLRHKNSTKVRTRKTAEEIRAHKQAYYRHNTEKFRKRGQDWRLQNPEKNRNNVHAWKRKNPEKRDAALQRYRARKAHAAICDFTAAQWREMLDAYGHRCVYCGRKMRRLTQDHITPLVAGGNHTKSNIVPACQSCNSKKGKGAPLVPVQPLLL